MRLLVAFSLLAACGAPGVRVPPQTHDPLPPAPGPPDGLHSLPALTDADDWEAVAYRPAYQTTARTEVVKVVIDLADDWHVYFLQSARYELHYTFVKAQLDPTADHAAFNTRQYRRDDRDYILLSLVHYLDGDFWTFELVAGDILDGPRLRRAFDDIRSKVFFADALTFRPLSPLQIERAASIALPTVDSDAMMAHMRYQALVPGTAYGYLRIVRGVLDTASVAPRDLIVAEHVPDELPPASGLVTSRLQAPLAHVAILSRNRGTPDMALRDAITDPQVVALEGQLVRLVVGPQDFSLERAELADAERDWAARRPARAFAPAADLDRTELATVCDLRRADVSFAGAKASQLGEVCAMGDVETPGGFVVPFARYQAHVGRTQAQIESMLTDRGFVANADDRARALAQLRTMLTERAVDRRLVDQVRERIGDSDARWIFRSSTNAEDLVGFNGAGLYSSVVIDAHPTRAQVADALREVWASVWLQRAYEEREWYRIEHAAVKMAVLVQPFVGDVVGNGVAITRNPFDEGRPGLYINLQASGGSVTGAGDDELPEQVLIYTWTEQPEFELLSRSTRTGGAAILAEADLQTLGNLLSRLHERLVPDYGGDANAVDVEFLLTRGERRFVVVQARPITIRYAPGQEWRTP